MARKKKATETGMKASEVEAVAAAAPEPTPKPTSRTAQKVVPKAEAKGSEVIPPVAIGLLEQYPSLPPLDTILAAFAEHYQAGLDRAAAAPVPEPEPEPVAPTPASRRSGRPLSITGSHGRPESVTAAPAPSWQAAPEVSEPAEPAAMAAIDAGEPDQEPLAEAPYEDTSTAYGTPAEGDDAVLFSDAPPEEDIFAQLGRSEPKADEEIDFTFTSSSDYSDPFIRPPAASEEEPSVVLGAEPDEATTALPAFDDVEAATAGEASPTDRTTMIQAMPDDDVESTAEVEATDAAETPADGGVKSRKSKKASRKKRG